MQRDARPVGLDMPSSMSQRNHSVSSDRTSSFSGSSLTSPPSVSPDPAYIALSAASQIVNSDRADRGYLEGRGSKVELDTAIVAPGSVALVNGFLDQLLYSFLASSRSTSIAALRPAIQEVLKPRLAKEAIQGADEELQGYMAGGDAEEFLAFHGGQSFRGDYDLNLIWRRTRLRCMVYTRLGDMEEEDEETYLEQDEENTNQGRQRLHRDIGSISPAAAIFLTSVLEFIGERAMFLAGEAAYDRFQAKGPWPDNPRAVVEEIDMEKLAFNKTWGRLWRSWKKRVRSSSLLSPRPASLGRQKTSSFSDSAGRKTSISEGDESGYFDHVQRPFAMELLQKDKEPAPVPAQESTKLPEEPDFSDFWAETPAIEKPDTYQGWRRSMIEVSKHDSITPTQTPSHLSQPNLIAPSGTEERPAQRHQRSSSVPARQTSFGSPVDEAFTTPRERPDPLDRDYNRADAEKELPRLTDDSSNVPILADDNGAVSTIYDGTISKGIESALENGLHQPSRGMSTYTESSLYTDEYDREMAPQALNFNASSVPTDTIGNGPINGLLPESRDSTVSSNYSFQGGEMDPVGQPRTLDQVSDRKENVSEGGAFPKRSDSLDRENDTGRSGHVGNLANLAMLQGHQLRTYDESGKAVKRDIPVLYEAPSNKDVIYDPDANVRSSTGPPDGGGLPTPIGVKYRNVESGPNAVSKPQGVPSLAPRQELIEAAHDISDEASSNAPSHGTPRNDTYVPAHRSQGSDSVRIGTLSAINTNTNQPSTAAGKPVDQRTQPLLVNTGTERAAVQRVSQASTALANGRISTSSIREGRPMTPSSTTSQMSSKIKDMIGRESGDLIRQPIPRRNSSDGGNSLVNGVQRTPRSVDKEQDFEDLIKSDETVRYTLTPQNMREMEAPESPRYQTHARSETQGSLTGSLNGINGLRANPTNVTEFAKGSSSFESARGPPPAPPKSPGVRSGRVASPREADAKDHNMRDFADFIRSTGPDTMSTHTAKPTTSGSSKKERPSSSTSQLGPKKLTKAPSVTSPKQSYAGPPPKPEVAPKRTASKLEAREATVSNNNATADLADFLRSGPDTMDSLRGAQRPSAHIQLATTSNGYVNGRQAVGSGTSVASTQDSFAASKMTQSSTNSRTGLLDASTRAQPSSPDAGRNSGAPSPRSIDLPGRPRKQRRVRDPYAIESDDENDDVLLPPEREEESLTDFLRNYTPPPAAATRPPPIGITGALKPPKQSVTLKERIQRNIAVIPDYRPLPPKAPKKASSAKSPPRSNEPRRKSQGQNSNNTGSSPLSSSSRPSANRNVSSGSRAPQLPPINPRATSPHLVSQNGTKMDSYRPTQPTYAKHVDRRPKKQLQAREEHGALSGPPQSGGMGDLADFLRETEPPPPSGPVGGLRPMSPTKDKEESSGFGRMFSRRKKETK
ncbi:MAG: hypothetical protein ALECFALPRED_000530 [Alectoria fallacina]|uniref:Uncharacterized protein n=1 Tax=Alectoria fallacina TaxID=1903189 RepID=A0A8H3JAB5_9LECA|nr:MAG: hypothetical protein ALECFALPRED_000530 [Alectoria fallacina]